MNVCILIFTTSSGVYGRSDLFLVVKQPVVSTCLTQLLADNGLALVNQATKTKHNLVYQTYRHTLSIVAPISCFNSCKQKYQLFSLAPLFFNHPESLTEGIIFETVLLKDDCKSLDLKGMVCDKRSCE